VSGMQNYGVIFPDQWCKGNKTDIGTKPLKMKLKISVNATR